MNLSIQRASEIAGVSKTTIAKAVRAGRIQASHLRDGQVLVHPNSLEAWIEKRFHEEGGTHDPKMISLREASELVKMRYGAVTDYVKRGTLSTHTNPAGRFILDRQEFEEWRKSLPPLREEMDPNVRWYTFQDIAELVGLNNSVIKFSAEKGELRATPCRTPYHSFVVDEAEVQRWLQERSKKFPQAELHGQRLSLEAAAARFGVTITVLRLGIKRGAIPFCKQMSEGGSYPYIVGSEDVEAYVKARASDDAWTLHKAAEFIGMEYTLLVKVSRLKQLPSRVDRHPNIGPRRIVDPDELMAWLAVQPVAYRKEAAHLPNLATVAEAARLSLSMESTVREAIRNGSLRAWKEQIPRRALDSWLKKRGFEPSWKQEKNTEWMRTISAAKLVDVCKGTICEWIRRKKVVSKGVGRRRLVQRESVLAQAARLDGEPRQAPEFAQLWRPGTKLTLDSYTSREAARLSGMTPHGAHAALVKARLKSKGKDGRSLLYPRKAIERWLLERFHQQGETLGQEQISLRDAAQATGRSVTYLRTQIAQGKLARQRNPAGELVLSRRDLELWMEARGPAPQRMNPAVRYTSALQIAEQLGLNFNTVHRHIRKGALQAVRGPHGAWMVSDEALAAWKASKPFQIVASRLRART
ncbi:hypothetical protein ABS71_08185 [bacterium SCN 62-11]|nr:MAG: hypothetical protein ABS71_08185 [bacterium SCN 62-11]